MAAIPPDEILPAPGDPSADMTGAVRPANAPKIKGHKRLLNRLKRMTSTSSLERMGRNRSSSSSSSGFRRIGKGSISCISLSSTLSHGQCWDNPLQSHGRFSNNKFDDEGSAPIRIVETELGSMINPQPTSVPLPAELRPSSRGSMLKLTVEDIAAEEEMVEKQNIDYWHTLPTELQLRILSCLMPRELARVARVSKSWYSLCFDGQLWARLDTSTYYRDIPQDVLVDIIFKAGPFIRYMNLRGCFQMEDAWLNKGEQISDACRNLTDLHLEDSQIDRPSLALLLVRNPSLARVSLCGLTTTLNSEVNIIAKCCPLLEYLDISWCENIANAHCLRRVVKACQQLKELRMSEFGHADDEELMAALFSTNNLDTLVMSHCLSLTDTAIKVLCQGMNPKIDILTGSPIVPPRRLKNLDLSHCKEISGTAIECLVGFAPELESLQLSFCSNIGVEPLTRLVHTTPNLTRLDLEEADAMNNDFLVELSKAPCALKLEHLNVSYCEHVGDTGMMQMAKNCPNLTSLELDNTRVSDLTLMELCNSMKKRGFSTSLPKFGLNLAVFDCGNITWTGIREVLAQNSHVPRSAPAKQVELLTTEPKDESESEPSSPLSPSSSTSSVTVLSPLTGATVVTKAAQYPREIIQLKCYYDWQPAVDKHTKYVLEGNLRAASRLERRWADVMIANEEAEAGGSGSRRRRRRARNATMMYNMDDDDDDTEYGYGPAGLASLGRRRAISDSSRCVVM